MKITVYSRCTYDEWYYRLFLAVQEVMPDDSELFYLWTWPDQFEKIKNTKITREWVGIFTIDSMQFSEYDYQRELQTEGCRLIAEIAKINPQTKFIIFSSAEKIERELDNIDNIYIVPIGHCLLQYDEFNKRKPIYDKNIDSTITFACLNRVFRFSRLTLVCYLLGNEFDKTGYISFDTSELDKKAPSLWRNQTWLEYCNWNLSTITGKERELILQGFEKLKISTDTASTINEPDTVFAAQKNNVDNFVNFLEPIYKNTFIEIVGETTFSEPSFLVTEKTLNTIWGCNFPIMIGGQGIVSHIRNDLGIDVFDDIIDHSYDIESDPVRRLTQAINLNKDLLKDVDNVKKLWKESMHRFIKNNEILRDNVENFYYNRTISTLKDILK